MIQITNQELVKLDEKVSVFYKLSHRYLNSLANLYGKEVYKKEFSSLLKEVDKTKPDSEFDELIIRNIRSNIELNNLVFEYINQDSPLTVPKFFDKISGGAFKFLEDRVKKPLWEERWKITEKTQEREYTRVSPFTGEAQDAAKRWIPKIKEDVLRYGKAEEILQEEFDMTILLLPPRESGGPSNWNSAINVFSLGSYGFDVFYRNNEVVAIPVSAYTVAFHEVLGHGAHQSHSINMPRSIRFTEEIGGVTPTKSITEGIAKKAEKGGYNFLKERAEELGISKEDIEISQTYSELEHERNCEYMYYALTKDREVREKEFDSYNHILELTQNPVIARWFKEEFKGKFEDLWGIIGHTLGNLHYKRMEEKIKEEFGEKFLEQERKRFHKASLSGVWSWEIYPEAVSYFLKQKDNS